MPLPKEMLEVAKSNKNNHCAVRILNYDSSWRWRLLSFNLSFPSPSHIALGSIKTCDGPGRFPVLPILYHYHDFYLCLISTHTTNHKYYTYIIYKYTWNWVSSSFDSLLVYASWRLLQRLVYIRILQLNMLICTTYSLILLSSHVLIVDRLCYNIFRYPRLKRWSYCRGTSKYCYNPSAREKPERWDLQESRCCGSTPVGGGQWREGRDYP